jgi:nucleotide-binding universal stress UspA family protein
MLRLKTILHPTDFSPTSEHALKVAASLARDYGARLVVLHVTPPPVVVYGEGVVPPDPVQHRETARRMLDEIRPLHGAVEVERKLLEGDAVWEILRMAAELPCDAIVMGTHGRTGLGRLLMGSVAEQVLRKAPCLVLTVKTPPQAELVPAALSVG